MLIRSREPTGHQQLAAAVIAVALADALHCETEPRRLAARAWLLRGGTDLAFWAACLGVPVDAVQAHARRRLGCARTTGGRVR